MFPKDKAPPKRGPIGWEMFRGTPTWNTPYNYYPTLALLSRDPPKAIIRIHPGLSPLL